MKKLISMVFVSALFISQMFSKEIKIVVLDADLEIPLEGVKISSKSNSEIRAVTDENGQAIINVSDGKKSESIETCLLYTSPSPRD